MGTFHAIEAEVRRIATKEQIERRSEPRELVREPAMLQVLRPQGGVRVRVHILDASISGLGMLTPVALPPGALVQVRLVGSVVLMGDVRYSVRCGQEFYTGIRIEDVADCKEIRYSTRGLA